MVEQFLNHIQRHNLCKTSDKILLAVSGGVDSMVMAHLFLKTGFTVGVAHCNFQLRGMEANADEQLVQDFCREQRIDFHVNHFDTAAIAGENRKSIQETARILRYEFFESLVRDSGYDFVATAHHINDHLETTILNLVRGTGIDGLKGISVTQGNIIRPVLFASREMIMDYAIRNGIPWREDASNQSDDYTRNFIRNNVIPLLREINPNLEDTFRDTSERLQLAQRLTRDKVEEIRREFCRQSDSTLIIQRAVFDAHHFSVALLWELIKDYGFNYDQCKQIINSEHPGRIFTSPTHRLVVDREQLLIDIPTPGPGLVMIDRSDQVVKNSDEELTICYVTKEDFQLNTSQYCAQVDASLINFPLTWRPWRSGDMIVPFGMSGKKKLSDYFIDLKIPLSVKEKITVVESGGEIIWIVGYRISDRFKITHETKKVMVIKAGRQLHS